MADPLPRFAVACCRPLASLQAMLTHRPVAKAGIVAGGFIAALAVSWAVMNLRRSLNHADPSQGMQAFGDLVLGTAVFSVLATLPAGLALYWLRPVARFWNILVAIALVSSGTGLLAFVVSGPLRMSLGNWSLLGDIRFAVLPITSLAWATCMLFAPAARLRWWFLGAALLDGGVFAVVIVVKFMLAPGA